jgi:hypothetical protein
MKTVAFTPLGTFDIRWGVGDPEEMTGPLQRLKRMKDMDIVLADPLHGEEKQLAAYRLGGRVILLGELSNGIWAVGIEASA